MSSQLFHVSLLFLLAVCCVESIGLGRIQGKLPFIKHKWGMLSKEKINEFKQSFGRATNVDRFLMALDRMNTARRDYKPTDAEKAEWAAKLKHLQNYVRSPRLPNEKTIDEINQAAGLAESLYGGDMKLTDAQVDALLGEFVDDDEVEGQVETREKRQAYYDGGYPYITWGTTFYYYFDENYAPAKQTVARMAIAFWANVTCINFVEDENAPNRVRFYLGTLCNSNVGMVGGEQSIQLTEGCANNFRNAAHEIAHALGFFHIMSRFDRNDSITVYLDNTSNTSNYNYGIPYDYGSLMQYDETAFSIDGTTKTMMAKVIPYQNVMGGNQVSFYDISMMNEHYQCKQFCPTGATCVNGGFRDSKNCNICFCPSGWGGPTCSDRAPGCGATLTATTTLQTQNWTIGTANVENPTFETCSFLIKAPAGNKVEVVIKALTSDKCTAGCTQKSIEVKGSSDHRLTGLRYCCIEDVGKKIISEGHIVPVIINNRYRISSYSFTYRSVSASTTSTVTTSQMPYASATYDSPTNPSTTTSKPATTTQKAACVDKSFCAQWIADYNYCDEPTYGAAQKKENCPVSCKMCSDQIWPAPTTKTSTTTTKAPTTTTTTCTDKTGCPGWIADLNFCESTEYSTQTKKDYCPVSCGLCDGVQTTSKKTTTTPLTACQRCTKNVDEIYNEKYYAKLGTPAYRYSNDPANNNCLIADWFCRVNAPETTAVFELWQGESYTENLYGYREDGKSSIGYNSTIAGGDYRPFVCNDDEQWSFDGVTDFKLDCFAPDD
ncbi:unnamed protein product, partial [Mesorhabditis belari]|uniref:Metalloendopeptidase n=1 Tax=Mesorhabditis belari TaxID=2138241 RepID=A0AAF3FEC2_9BILA